jgi:hypothetical protein
MSRASIIRLSVLASLLGWCSNGSAGEFYDAMVFGSQSHPKQLRFIHTWATFVKATGAGTDPNNSAIKVNTMSWLPATLVVNDWDPKPEPGVDLEPTLAAVASRRIEPSATREPA